MHGAYDQAIAAFDRALKLHPGWKEAEENRALAVARRDRLKIQGGNMTERTEEGNEAVIKLASTRSAARTIKSVREAISSRTQNSKRPGCVGCKPPQGIFCAFKFNYQAQERPPGAKPKDQ
jgi:Ca-activated chloride channel homolog